MNVFETVSTILAVRAFQPTPVPSPDLIAEPKPIEAAGQFSMGSLLSIKQSY